MIDLIVAFAIYVFLQRILIDKPIKRSLMHSTNTQESIVERRKLMRRRKVCSTFFVVLFAFMTIIGELQDYPEKDFIIVASRALVFLIILYWYLKLSRKYKSLLGHVSFGSLESFLQDNNRFALFLRGFKDDDYGKESSLDIKEDDNTFSEYYFYRVLRPKIRLVAVGMTKELDSPYGASRIYLDNDTWQPDVVKLMTKADVIYILVNDRESCIWEISQAACMKEKTVLIVNDWKKYMTVRNILKAKITLPDIPTDYLLSGRLVYITYTNGQYFIKPYDNTIEGYGKIANVSVKTTLYRESLRRRIRRNWIVFFSVSFICIAVLGIFALLTYQFEDCAVNDIQCFLSNFKTLIISIFILIAILYVSPLVWNTIKLFVNKVKKEKEHTTSECTTKSKSGRK